MERLKNAQYIALGATICSAIGFFTGGMSGGAFGSVLMSIGVLAGIASYFFGGFGKAVKMAGGIAKWGWFIAPFPYDIATFLFAFIFAIYAFLFLPIIPIRKAYKESMKG